MDTSDGRPKTETHWTGEGAAPVPSSFQGSVTFASGEVAHRAGVGTITLGAPDEPFAGVPILTWPDGSTGWQSFNGRMDALEDQGVATGRSDRARKLGTGQFAGQAGGGELPLRLDRDRWQAAFQGCAGTLNTAFRPPRRTACPPAP